MTAAHITGRERIGAAAFWLLAAVLLAWTGCAASTPGDGNGNGDGNGDGGGALTFSAVNDFLYQLQRIDFDAAGDTAFDLVVTDYSADGSDDQRYSAAQIAGLKDSPGGEKLVLAYMSIGEAETYRWYWHGSWDADHDGEPDAGAPAWLGPENPDWAGNYKVRYWDPSWRQVIFGTADSYLDKVIDAGFDGVYLDIIDAYEYWGPEGESGLDRASADRDMVELVKAIAEYARGTRGIASFGVFPQNGEALSGFADYVAVTTGIGREDVWYNDDEPESAQHTAEVLSGLDVFRDAGKLVLVIDYVTEAALIDDFYAKAEARGYVPYAPTRDLDQLTIHPGHEPD